ncbi:hypothetical protein LPMP_355060 [Leishmania panamensis]|uniref:Ribosomal protein, putative n=1 Tax=Leishmania panamensis TaxID=5679 RepID=A0A088SLH3_LEIPA|nr:hypothetical protein LPMP_355060 [Leishmania panamensis]AIO02637.1 hypothetical protein LPMP_355060 [Leishmania panamensis]
MSASEEEIDMILSMFSDECERYEGKSNSVLVHLPFHFELQVTLPAHGYPDESYPQLYLLSGPNAQLASAFSQEVHRRMRDEIPLSVPMLTLLIPLAQSVAEELKDLKEKARQDELMEKTDQLQWKEYQRETGIDIWSGGVVTDRRSRFVAHMARVHSIEEVREVVCYLRSIKSIACAAHPTIYAYRFTDANGVLQKDVDDDGESGASIKMMFLLDHLQVDGYIVVVTRWWGGILLGPDRFKHIMEVTRNILRTIPEREKEMAASGKRNCVK